jgi:tetratricopeptide (TPR) repeat protein
LRNVNIKDFIMRIVFTALLLAGVALAADDLDKLRDRQDRPALGKMAESLQADAEKSAGDPNKWYRAAVAYSYVAEVAYEMRDKPASQRAAEAGVKDAEKAVSLNGKNAEYYRVLGTLCGQVIPANPLLGALQYGKRAKEALDKAIEMDPKSSRAHVAHGVGYYYLPTNFGGGPENAIKDYQKAISLDPKNAEAYLWMGIAYSKQHQTEPARAAFSKALQFAPERVWAKQQLEKLPPKS